MTSDLQHQAISMLAELWSLSPDVRLGQLLAHLGFLGEIHVGRGLGYIDDDELMAVMSRHLQELVVRQHGAEDERQDSGPTISVSGSSLPPMEASPADISR
ncbi:MAG TPA: hypothetical protein VFI31_10045 [Pirellulales bacterium]|nr:hypothetical protein [Pirellulales bacterium]